jgi:CheY-like chemotaxis protein
VLGDGVRLKQIFNNLIGNAIKFTDQGVVEVRIATEREGVFVRVIGEVADTGVGVPEAALESIFSPFGQTEEGLARGGAGLGLSVCHELAQRMHGSITAARRDPAGTVFRIEATLYDVPPAASEGHAETDDGALLPPLKILIADDNPTNRLVAQTLCEHLGCESRAVENGALALDALRDEGRFDLVLMDIKMPVMDGLAAMRAIRQLPAPYCETPVLALTANADPWDAAQYLADGMDGVVEKPIKIAQLADAIATALKVERRRAA